MRIGGWHLPVFQDLQVVFGKLLLMQACLLLLVRALQILSQSSFQLFWTGGRKCGRMHIYINEGGICYV